VLVYWRSQKEKTTQYCFLPHPVGFLLACFFLGNTVVFLAPAHNLYIVIKKIIPSKIFATLSTSTLIFKVLKSTWKYLSVLFHVLILIKAIDGVHIGKPLTIKFRKRAWSHLRLLIVVVCKLWSKSWFSNPIMCTKMRNIRSYLGWFCTTRTRISFESQEWGFFRTSKLNWQSGNEMIFFYFRYREKNANGYDLLTKNFTLNLWLVKGELVSNGGSITFWQIVVRICRRMTYFHMYSFISILK